MDAISYRLYYDAADMLPDFSRLTNFLVVFILCVGFFLYFFLMKKRVKIAFVIFRFLIIIGGRSEYIGYKKYEQCKEWAKSEDYQLVEGTVEHFNPMPSGGHVLESFTVQGIKFEYSDFDSTQCGFNNTASHGGPIRQGLRVKIGYRNGLILRLWIDDSFIKIKYPDPWDTVK